MAETTDNLVLEHLRHIRAKIDDMSVEFGYFGRRLSNVERMMAVLVKQDVDQTDEIEQLKTRVGRIERRLELTE